MAEDEMDVSMFSEKKRYPIIKEILDTEESFLSDLIAIQNQFIGPAVARGILSIAEANIFKKLPIDAICSWSEKVISQINQEVQQYLASNRKEKMCVGDIFVSNLDDEAVSAFTRYISLYSEVSELVATFNRRKHPFASFLKRKERIIRGKTLADYLIAAVQRPPRYILLIKDLLKKTPQSHPDFTSLMRAENEMKVINSEINFQTGALADLKKLEQFFSRFSRKDRKTLERYYSLNRKPLGSVLLSDKEGKVFELFALDDILVCTHPVEETNALEFIWATCITLTEVEKGKEDPLRYSVEIRTSIPEFPFCSFETHTFFAKTSKEAKQVDELARRAVTKLRKNIYFENYDCALKELMYSGSVIMNSAHWSQLAQSETVFDYKKGELIFEKGRKLGSIFWIKKGIVKFALQTEEISSILFRRAGEFFGEVEFALYKSSVIKPTSIDLIAEEDVQLVPISYSSLISLLHIPSALTTRFYYHLCCILGSNSQRHLYHYSDQCGEASLSPVTSASKGRRQQSFEHLDVKLAAVNCISADEIIRRNAEETRQEESWWRSFLRNSFIETEDTFLIKFENRSSRLCIDADKLVVYKKPLLGEPKVTNIPYHKISEDALVEDKLHIVTSDSKKYVFRIVNKKEIEQIYTKFLVRYGGSRRLAPQELLQKELKCWRDSLESVEFLKMAQITTYQKGEYILNLGRTWQTLYVILEGETQAVTYLPNGSVFDDVTLSSGQFVGEYSFLFGEYSTMSVIALSDCKVASVHRKEFGKLCSNDYSVVSSLLAIIANSISEDIEYRAKFFVDAASSLKQPRSLIASRDNI